MLISFLYNFNHSSQPFPTIYIHGGICSSLNLDESFSKNVRSQDHTDCQIFSTLLSNFLIDEELSAVHFFSRTCDTSGV